MSEIALNLSNVTKDFPGLRALDGVSFQVKKGSVHGFLGPNGAGKSTTMKIISGLMPPSSGFVEVNGEGVGFLPEIPPLYSTMSVLDYLSFVQKIHLGKVEKQLLEKVLTRCGLSHVRHRLIAHLSKGFKQRIGIASALVYDAEIIILDEPTVALDPYAISEIRELITDLKATHTILLSTHQLLEAEKVCDEVTIISKGKILISAPLDEIQEKVRGQMALLATVLEWNESNTKALLAKDGVHSVNIEESKKALVNLSISYNGNVEVRAEIAQFLANMGGLLDYQEQQLELEDFFKEVVSR